MMMISVEEALRLVLNASSSNQWLQPVGVSIEEDAFGKSLADEIHAPDPLPPYPASIKVGYAVIAADGPGEYPVITESRAGNDGLDVTLSPGTVAYVTTGGNSGEPSIPQVVFQLLPWRLLFISIKLYRFGRNFVLQASVLTAIQGKGQLQSTDQACIHQTRRCSNNSSNNRHPKYSNNITELLYINIGWVLRNDF